MFAKFEILFWIFLLLAEPLKANDACGSSFDVVLTTYRCPVGHYCCDSKISSCCPEEYVCIENSTRCLHIAIIIVPIVISVLIVCFFILCLVCCCNVMRNTKKQRQSGIEDHSASNGDISHIVIDQQYLSTKL